MSRYLHAYGRQVIDDDDIAAVEGVLRGDFLTGGPVVSELETKISNFVGARSVSLCNSGTSALHLAMMALGVDSSWTVFVPAISFVATANAARMCGAEVEFVDVDPRTGLMTPQLLREALDDWRSGAGQGPIAIVPVHLAGQTVDLSALSEIAQSCSAKVIVDACHAFGSSYQHAGKTQFVGDCYFSDAEVFSFHPVKNIAMGEGGAVTTNDSALASRVNLLRSHGITRDEMAFHSDVDQVERGPWYYEMQMLGFNYRISDIQAALGISQLNKLDQFKATRAELVIRYHELLRELDDDRIAPLPALPGCSPTWHLMVVLIDFEAVGKSRTDLMTGLRAQGIGSQVHYIPIYSHPYYQGLKDYKRLPGAEQYYSRALSLPLHPNMEVGDVDVVVKALREELEL